MREEAAGIAVDDSANSYITGRFEGLVDFDPGPGVYNLSAKGSTDIFIQKISGNGNLLWVKSIGGKSLDGGNSITLDSTGNIYIAGSFMDTVDFDPFGSSFIVPASGSQDAFLLKLTNDGSFQWVRSLGGSALTAGNKVIAKGADVVYLAGWFSDSLIYNPTSPHIAILSKGVFDAYVMKVNGGGSFQWIRTWGGSMSATGINDVCLDGKGNIYSAGYFNNKVDFDPSTATRNLTGIGNSDCFLQKMDRDGKFILARAWGGPLNEDPSSLVYDGIGNLYFAGKFAGTSDFDPDSLAVQNRSSKGAEDFYCLKLDTTGHFIWVQITGGSHQDICRSLAMGPSGSLSLIGVFKGTVDFDPGTSTFNQAASGPNAFIQILDSSGVLRWARSIGNQGKNWGNTIDVDALGNVYLAGGFEGNSDFDPDSSTYYLFPIGQSDIFTLKLSECGFVNGWDSVISCNSFTWNNNVTYTASTDTPSMTFTNVHGCDSTSRLHLIINSVDEGVVVSDPIITSKSLSGKYQWLRCDSGYSILTGDTLREFTAKTNGEYAVVVTDNGCTDTSQCIIIKSLGADKISSSEEITIRPNPFHDIINIDLGKQRNVTLRIYNMMGTQVYENQFDIVLSTLALMPEVPEGPYLLTVDWEGEE